MNYIETIKWYFGILSLNVIKFAKKKGGSDEVVTIHFRDKANEQEAIKIFKRFGDATFNGYPMTYIVSQRIADLLSQQQISFTYYPNFDNWLTPDVIADVRKSLKQARNGEVLYVEDFSSLDDIIEAGRQKFGSSQEKS